jgi:hypothetical protein
MQVELSRFKLTIPIILVKENLSKLAFQYIRDEEKSWLKYQIGVVTDLLIKNPARINKFYNENDPIDSKIKESLIKFLKEKPIKDFSLKSMILGFEQPVGMGNGIFQTTSSIFGNLVLQYLKPFIASLFKTETKCVKHLITSDDMLILISTRKENVPSVQDKPKLLEMLSKWFGQFNLELSLAKCSIGTNGKFSFNSEIYYKDLNESISPIINDYLRIPTVSRLLNNFAKDCFYGVSTMYNDKQTKLNQILSEIQFTPEQQFQFVESLRLIMKHELCNFMIYPGDDKNKYSDWLFDPICRIRCNGALLPYNNKEEEFLMMQRILYGKKIYDNEEYTINEYGERSLIIKNGDTSWKFEIYPYVKIPHYTKLGGILEINQKGQIEIFNLKMNEALDRLTYSKYLTQSNINDQKLMNMFLNHLSESPLQTRNVAKYIKWFKVPFIQVGNSLFNYSFDEINVPISHSIENYLSRKILGPFGYTIEDLNNKYDDFEQLDKSKLTMMQRIYDPLIDTNKLYANEIISNQMSNIFENDLRFRRKIRIGPCFKESFNGILGIPEEDQYLIDYILNANYMSDWIVCQESCGNNNYKGYGVLVDVQYIDEKDKYEDFFNPVDNINLVYKLTKIEEKDVLKIKSKSNKYVINIWIVNDKNIIMSLTFDSLRSFVICNINSIPVPKILYQYKDLRFNATSLTSAVHLMKETQFSQGKWIIRSQLQIKKRKLQRFPMMSYPYCYATTLHLENMGILKDYEAQNDIINLLF